MRTTTKAESDSITGDKIRETRKPGRFLGVVLRIRLSYWIYAAVSAAFSLSWANMDGVPRYFSVIFPLYIVLAVATERWKWSYVGLFGWIGM